MKKRIIALVLILTIIVGLGGRAWAEVLPEEIPLSPEVSAIPAASTAPEESKVLEKGAQPAETEDPAESESPEKSAASEKDEMDAAPVENPVLDGPYALPGVENFGLTVAAPQAGTYTEVTGLANVEGTTINVFDYWVGNRGASDGVNPDDFWDSGINKDHMLLFGFQMNGYQELNTSTNQMENQSQKIGAGAGQTASGGLSYNNGGKWNGWTGSGSGPVNGIVNRVLAENGYPSLALDSSAGLQSNWLGDNVATHLNGRDRTESLAYLFDPEYAQEGKASYTNVGGLLRVDEDGYYYYDSNGAFASLLEGLTGEQYQKGADGVNFKLYTSSGIYEDSTGGVSATADSPDGQFFPFNTSSQVFDRVSTDWGDEYYVTSTHPSINHYFGMHMKTWFVQQYGGYTDKERNDAVTYEFSGDDDVWIFIDGVLVADLGGVHDAVSVQVNFATGQISIASSSTNTKKNETTGQTHFISYQTSIVDMFKKAGVEITGDQFLGNTFASGTYHTLDFFYLERGNTDSNMSLKYNLITIPDSSLIKVDQVGDPVPGATFTLYAADSYEQYGTDAPPIATGTTDRDGEFTFLDGRRLPIPIENLWYIYRDRTDKYGNNLVLVETDPPDGYRTGSEGNLEIGLYFYESVGKEVLLLSKSVWDNGAYAIPKVTTSMPSVIRSAGDSSKTVTLRGNGAVNDPLMFAVVFQKQKNGSWYPVSGDPVKGWTVESGDSWGNVLTAAQANPYIFKLAVGGAYQVEIENLPGDIRTYEHICKDEGQAQYTVRYFYSMANTLDQASEGNTWLIDSDPTDGAEQYALDRTFSVNMFVTNIKNQLLVQKVDDAGNTVTGAQFSLYKATDVTVGPDDTVTVKENATAYDRLTTANLTAAANGIDLDGGGVFPSGNNMLVEGEYYLIEISTPEEYKLNDTAVHVVVNNTGIYANAGTEDDGVSVLRGVGSVMRSMVQFAAEDKVDTTLHTIKASLATGTYADNSFSWNGVNWDSDPVLHLEYDNQNGRLDYGLHGSEAESVDTLTLATNVGWSKLLIQQCDIHKVVSGNYTDLNGRDITNLFSGTVMVRVTNHRIGNLEISKKVIDEDNSGPENASFTFTLTVTDNGKPISGTYDTVDQDNHPGTITFSGDSVTVTLTDSQSLTILDLPTGATYKVEETPMLSFSPSVEIIGGSRGDSTNGNTATGTIPHNATVEVAYINTYEVLYTDFSFTKVDGTGFDPTQVTEDDYLRGAEFALYRYTGTNWAGVSGSLLDTQNLGNDWKAAGKQTSGDQGLVTFSNLEAGHYRLVETKAPGGFQLPKGQWNVEVTITNNVGSFTILAVEEATSQTPGVVEGNSTYYLMNYKPTQPPITGGDGGRSYWMVGGSMMAVGTCLAVAWMWERRRRANP